MHHRGRNAITQRSVEPLPHVEHFVVETRGSRFFSKIDLDFAYWQLRIRDEDQLKTSFRVPGGQCELRVGAFGLHCMSSLLMRYMHTILVRGRFVQVYCHDMLIFSKKHTEHLEHVRLVLATLRRHKLFATNPSPQALLHNLFAASSLPQTIRHKFFALSQGVHVPITQLLCRLPRVTLTRSTVSLATRVNLAVAEWALPLSPRRVVSGTGPSGLLQRAKMALATG
jgi:hypothetical protein